MNPPTFKARVHRGVFARQLAFVCPHCSTPKKAVEHFHGGGAGHYAAHCHKPGSPYLQTGYVLEIEDAAI